MRGVFQGLTRRAVGLVAFESTLIVGGVIAAALARLGLDGIQGDELPITLSKAVFIAAVCQTSFYFGELYNLKVVSDRREMFIRVVQSLGITSLILGVVYFWFPGLVIGRGVFLIAAVLVVVLVIAWRLCWEWLARTVGPRERLLIIGTNAAAISLGQELHERRELGVEIVGFITAEAAVVGPAGMPSSIIGTVEEIPALVKRHNVCLLYTSPSPRD